MSRLACRHNCKSTVLPDKKVRRLASTMNWVRYRKGSHLHSEVLAEQKKQDVCSNSNKYKSNKLIDVENFNIFMKKNFGDWKNCNKPVALKFGSFVL